MEDHKFKTGDLAIVDGWMSDLSLYNGKVGIVTVIREFNHHQTVAWKPLNPIEMVVTAPLHGEHGFGTSPGRLTKI